MPPASLGPHRFPAGKHLVTAVDEGSRLWLWCRRDRYARPPRVIGMP